MSLKERIEGIINDGAGNEWKVSVIHSLIEQECKEKDKEIEKFRVTLKNLYNVCIDSDIQEDYEKEMINAKQALKKN